MSKLKQLSVWALGALMPLAMAAPVSAESTCQIGYTGPDSNNLCTSKTTYTCTIDNENNVTVDNENVQVAVSGGANNEGNTTGGDAKTGSATNSNNVTFNATVTNGNECSVVATVPATEVPSAPVGGSGAAAPTAESPVKQQVRAVGGAGAVTPTVLADTGSRELFVYLVSALGLSAVVFGASRLYGIFLKS